METVKLKTVLMHPKKFLVLLLLVVASACQKKVADNIIAAKGFESIPLSKPLLPGILDEASGIADSKANPGYLWVIQDSGNPNELALLSHNAVFLKNIKIEKAVNRDWEALRIANGPLDGINYIYIADIGDNNLSATQYFIYRFPEPASTTEVVPDCDKITFQYPDGAHNAEAILVNNSTKDIYIITKNDTLSRIYKLGYPQNTNEVNTALFCGTLSFNNVTASAFSPDRKEILVKTYSNIYQWNHDMSKAIEKELSAETPVTISYQSEPQGEAMSFKNDNSGFFTLSERPAFITAVNLNFYRRK